MALKLYKPTTPSLRGTIAIDRSELHKGKPEKSLTRGARKSGGRDTFGHNTSKNKGGGHKRKHRIIDFKRQKDGVKATVENIQYDPFRTAFIALIEYTDGEKAYIVAPRGTKSGDVVESGENVDATTGNSLPLKNIPTGTAIHNIELKPGKGGQLIRTAGSYAQLLGKDMGYAIIKLRSGETRKILDNCRATVGVVSNSDNQNTKVGKAGRSRWKGIRPHVRGVAMNPVDHPHGGGEGKTSGGRHPVSPTGVPTKGYKTRSKKKQSSKFIVTTRHKKK